VRPFRCLPSGVYNPRCTFRSVISAVYSPGCPPMVSPLLSRSGFPSCRPLLWSPPFVPSVDSRPWCSLVPSTSSLSVCPLWGLPSRSPKCVPKGGSPIVPSQGVPLKGGPPTGYL
jgi:hypothetical protein